MEKSSRSANTPLFLSVHGDVEKGGLEAATRTRTLTPPNPKTIPKTTPDMMHLDPRPMNHDELSFQDEARLMAYLREVASEREFGSKKRRDLDFEERRASDIWHSARFDFIPDPDKEYEVVCKRMDWYHGLYQLADPALVPAPHWRLDRWK